MEAARLRALRTEPLNPSELHPKTMLSLEQYMAALIEAEQGRDDFFFDSDPAPRTIVEELRPTVPARPAICHCFGSMPVPAIELSAP